MAVTVGGLSFDVYPGGPGDGAPALLLHGFPQHAGEWDEVATRLHDAGVRTYAMNQRGYSPGARPEAAHEYRMANCVADAVGVLDGLGLARAHVVGHDWGALVGWHLACRHPDRVATLTAVSVPHPLAMAAALSSGGEQRERSAYVGLFRQVGKAEELLQEDGGRRLRALFDGCPPERVEAYITPLAAPGALTAALNWYRALSGDDLSGLGPSVIPTTYIWGDRDIAISAEAAHGCAAFVTADYRFAPLAGVGHWVPDEAPDVVANEIVARMAPYSG